MSETEVTRGNADFNDKLAAQQRHEHLASTVRIAVGELCYLAEQLNDLLPVERIYAITEFLEAQLSDGEVAYASPNRVADVR